MTPTGFQLQRLRAQIKPFRLHWFPRLRSTNDHAIALRRAGRLFAPAIVLTGHQTAGRGRNENRWWSCSGVLTVTFAFAVEPHLEPHQLPLIAGLAVRNAASELADYRPIGLKWPNDLVYDGRKLAGLLCERFQKADLIGLGLNVNLDPDEAPEALRGRITSLARIAHRRLDPTDVLVAVARQLHRTLSLRNEQPFAQFLREYDAHHALVGRTVTVAGEGAASAVTGRCEGLDRHGRLVLRHGQELHRVISGQVTRVA